MSASCVYHHPHVLSVSVARPYSSIGYPEPEVKWYRDERKLKPNKDRRMTMHFDTKQDLHILTIKDAVPSDAGEYKLKLTNEVKSISVRVMVTVRQETSIDAVQKVQSSSEPAPAVGAESCQETPISVSTPVAPSADEPKVAESLTPCKPKIVEAPQPVEFREGESFSLHCRVSGNLGVVNTGDGSVVVPIHLVMDR